MLRVFQKTTLVLVFLTIKFQSQPSCPDPKQTLEHHSALFCYLSDPFLKTKILPSWPVTKQNLLYFSTDRNRYMGKRVVKEEYYLACQKCPRTCHCLCLCCMNYHFLLDYHTLRLCVTQCLKEAYS